jgi:hypothetical protein
MLLALSQVRADRSCFGLGKLTAQASVTSSMSFERGGRGQR